MAYIEWNSNISVNIMEIDNQHKKLIEVINELHDSMIKGKSKDILNGLLNDLTNYTVEHFGLEEYYMDKFNYINSSIHKKEHKDFIKKVAEYHNDLKNGKFLLSVQVMNFLKDWLINHIQGSDKKYSEFFIEKGYK